MFLSLSGAFKRGVVVHVEQLHHEAKALASNHAKVPDGAVSEPPRVEPEAGEPEAAQTVDEQETAEAEEEKKAMEKAMEDAIAEQKKREEAEQDKKALGVSMQRVAELEVRVWGRYRVWKLAPFVCVSPTTWNAGVRISFPFIFEIHSR